MSDEWYYAQNGKQLGPVSPEKLKQLADDGQLGPLDMIWKQGMQNWVAAKTVKGLFGQPSPSSEPVTARPVQPVNTETVQPQTASASPHPEGPQGFHVDSPDSRAGGKAIPKKFLEFLPNGETVRYAEHPSKAARNLSMLMSAISGLVVGLPLYLVGALVTVPLFVAISYFQWKHSFYIITTKRIIVSRGVFNIAVKILPIQNVQMISVNTGIIDRWLGLNSIEFATAASGGGGTIFATTIFSILPGLSPGHVQIRWVKNAPHVVSLIPL